MIDIKKAIEKRYAEEEPIQRTTITVEEAATYLNLSKDFVYRLVREKKIPAIRIGSRIMFKTDTLDKWLSELEQESME